MSKFGYEGVFHAGGVEVRTDKETLKIMLQVKDSEDGSTLTAFLTAKGAQNVVNDLLRGIEYVKSHEKENK